MTNLNTLPNPYTATEVEAEALNAEVMALYRTASLLSDHEPVQVAAVNVWLRKVVNGSREILRALVWELCNSVRQHAAMGIEFPLREASDCTCGKDHDKVVNAYNQFLTGARLPSYDKSIAYVDDYIGDEGLEVIIGWIGSMVDFLAERREA